MTPAIGAHVEETDLEAELLEAVREHRRCRAEAKVAHDAQSAARARLVAILHELDVTGFSSL